LLKEKPEDPEAMQVAHPELALHSHFKIWSLAVEIVDFVGGNPKP
jgi:hypothetical protein